MADFCLSKEAANFVKSTTEVYGDVREPLQFRSDPLAPLIPQAVPVGLFRTPQ